FFFSSRRRHTRWPRDWSSDVCSSDLSGAISGSRSDSGVPDGRGSLHWRAGRYRRTRDEVTWTFTEHQPNVAAAAQSGHSGLDYRSEERRVGERGGGGGERGMTNTMRN